MSNVVALQNPVPAARQLSNTVFGVDFFPANHTTPVWQPTEFTPSTDPFYLFDKDKLKISLLWNEGLVCNNLFISGPTGAGKSSLVEQFSARNGKQVFRLACHGKTEMQDLSGHLGLVQDTPDSPAVMRHQIGVLIRAMKLGGILLMDEGDTLHPSVALGLNGVLDGAPYLIPETGELVHPHPDFRIVFTGNTAGSGDSSGGYRGTQRQNLAFMDRFISLAVDYLKPTEEALILHRALKAIPDKIRIDAKAIEVITSVSDDVRKAFLDGSIDATISSRAIRRWAKMACFLGGDLVQAIKPVVTNKAKPEDAQAILGILQRSL